jgi:hypothetical protein
MDFPAAPSMVHHNAYHHGINMPGKTAVEPMVVTVQRWPRCEAGPGMADVLVAADGQDHVAHAWSVQVLLTKVPPGTGGSSTCDACAWSFPMMLLALVSNIMGKGNAHDSEGCVLFLGYLVPWLLAGVVPSPLHASVWVVLPCSRTSC